MHLWPGFYLLGFVHEGWIIETSHEGWHGAGPPAPIQALHSCCGFCHAGAIRFALAQDAPVNEWLIQVKLQPRSALCWLKSPCGLSMSPCLTSTLQQRQMQRHGRIQTFTRPILENCGAKTRKVLWSSSLPVLWGLTLQERIIAPENKTSKNERYVVSQHLPTNFSRVVAVVLLSFFLTLWEHSFTTIRKK